MNGSTIIRSLLVILISVLTFQKIAFTQNVAITDDDGYSAESTAMLDIKSTSKGLLVPRMDSLQRVGIVSPATGLLVFDTDASAFYYYDGTNWLNLTTNVISPASATVNDVLFSVINTNGDTVFAVYPEGVQINVGDGAKANKGGFAVGGLASGKLGQSEFLRVTADSVRIYIDTTTGTKAKKGGFAVGGLASGKTSGPTFFTVSDDSVRIYIDTTISSKANKGGFAVGGLASGKGIVSEYLMVSDDSVRIYVSDPDAKANKGGFAVGGLASGKLTATDFMKLTPKNYFIGHESGLKTTGLYNSFIGYQSGTNNITGEYNSFMGFQTGYTNNASYNTFIGYKSGYTNESGSWNVFSGYESGLSNTSGDWNVFIGHQSGNSNTEGQRNVFLGDKSGFSNISGVANVFIGKSCGYSNTTSGGNVFIGDQAGYYSEGSWNTFLGTQSGNANLSGNYNVFVGSVSGQDNTTGSSNVFIGHYSGYQNSVGNKNVFVGSTSGSTNTGSENIFIGYSAGKNETGSDKLYIDNSSTSSPLIYGDFSSNTLRFNADVGINATPAEALDVNGAVKIGTTSNTNQGTLRYTGTDFEGYTSSGWLSLTGDIRSVIAGNGLSGGATSGDATLTVGAGDGIDVFTTSIAVDVTDILGTGLLEISNNIGVYSLMAADGSPTHAVYVNNEGDVGIGTTSPGSHQLSVTSANTTTTGSTGYFKNTHDDGLAMMIENSSYSSTDNALLIVKRGSSGDIMRLDSYHGSPGGWEVEFKFTNDGIGYADGSWQGGGADFAEYFPKENNKKSELEPGDILLISDQEYAVGKEGEPYSKRILGVYSDNPALVGNADIDRDNSNYVLTGLVGVIPTKVNTENGAIKVGDFITSASVAGVGMKANKPCMVVGRALESYNGEGVGKIKVLVNVHWSGYSE